jgi:hypothetical protein
VKFMVLTEKVFLVIIPLSKILVLCLIIATAFSVFALPQETKSDTVYPSDEVLIAPTAVVMPLNKVLLVRKGPEYCALRFTEMWKARTKEDVYNGKRFEAYSRYEAYYQGDGTGHFLATNVERHKDELIRPWVKGFHPFVWNAGPKKTEIKCGPIALLWVATGCVSFFPSGLVGDEKAILELGIELAPTPWSDIFEVNVADPRIRWYKYDGSRQRISVPIDRLWGG